jgi:hypothetical protein
VIAFNSAINQEGFAMHTEQTVGLNESEGV